MEDEFVVSPPQLPVENDGSDSPTVNDTVNSPKLVEAVAVPDDFGEVSVSAVALTMDAALEDSPGGMRTSLLEAPPAVPVTVPPAPLPSPVQGPPTNAPSNEATATATAASSTKRKRDTPAAPATTQAGNAPSKRPTLENSSNSSTTAATATASTAAATTTTKRGVGRPSSRETRAPKPPRTAFELYTLKYKRAAAASKKNKAQQQQTQHKASGGAGTGAPSQSQAALSSATASTNTKPAKTPGKSSAVPTMAKIRASYEKLSFREKQQWKIQQAEDLVRYETQLATYAALTESQELQQQQQHNALHNGAGYASNHQHNHHNNNSNDNPTALSLATTLESNGHADGHLSSEHHPYYHRSGGGTSLMGKTASGNAHPSLVSSANPAVVAGSSSSSAYSKLSLARSSFNDFVFELLRFKADKGHCRVPVKKGGVLGKWVDKIRKEYKKLKPLKRNLPAAPQKANASAASAGALAAPTRPQGQGHTTTTNNNNNNNNTVMEPLLFREPLGVGATTGAAGANAGVPAASGNAVEAFDLTIGDHGVYFANAYGRIPMEAGGDASSVRDPEAVPDNVRLDCYTPNDLVEDQNAKQLHNGMQPQQHHRKATMRFDRIKILSFLGMVWEFPNEDYEEIWQKHFQDLLAYKEEHGNCNVPQKGFGRLSWWVKIQRELYVNTKGARSKENAPNSTTAATSTTANGKKKSSSRPRQLMPQHRITQLESVGFEWRIRPPALKWEERYKELIRYKKEVGDCNVPQNYPPNRVLGKWVMKQRGYYYDKVRGKKSPLNADRQSKLEAIGFCWVAPHVAKTKAKLPLREDIIKEQLRARDVVATVVAAATSGSEPTAAGRHATHNTSPVPASPEPLQPAPSPQQQQQAPHPQAHPQHPQQAQPPPAHHPQHHDVYHYHDVTGGIPYFVTPSNHPHEHPPPQPTHVGGLGPLDGSLLSHISPTEHYLARPVDHDPSQLQQHPQPPPPPQQQQQQQQSPQSYHHQHAVLQQPDPQQQQQQQPHINHDGQAPHGGHHSPQNQQQQQQQQQQQAMMFHPQPSLPPGSELVGSPGPVGAPGYPPYISASGPPGDATATTSPQQQQAQQQQQQQQQQAQQQDPNEPYFAL